MTVWIYTSWYSVTDEIVFQMPWGKRIHFSCCSPAASRYYTHTVISHPIKQMLVLYIKEVSFSGSKNFHYVCVLRWQYGLRQMKWCTADCETSSSFSLSRSHLLMRFRMFKSGVFRARVFLWKPPSAVTKLIRITTRIFLQIRGAHLNFRQSLGDMKGPHLPVNPFLSDRQCLYSLQPFLL